MHRGVALDILIVDIGSQLDQRLDVFDVESDCRKVERGRSFVVFCSDFYFVDPLKQEDSRDAVIALSGAVVHSLVAVGGLADVCLEREDQTVDDVVVPGSCCQVDGLTAEVGVSVVD